MARKKKVVAGVIGDTTYYFNEKGQIVDETGQAAPPAFAKAIAASGVEPPKQEEKPKKPEKQRRPAPTKTPNQVIRENVERQEEAIKESKPIETQAEKKSRLGRLIERVSGSGASREANQAKSPTSDVREKQPVGSRIGGFFNRIGNTADRAVRSVASGVLATEYMGLGFVPGMVGNILSGDNKPERGSRTRSAGEARAAKTLSTFSGTTSGMDQKEKGNVSVLSKLLDASEKQNEKLDDIVKALDRQNTSRIEDNRELKQQNEQIIRLLQAIAAQGGIAKGGSSTGGGGLGALGLGGLLTSLLGGGRTLLKAGATGIKMAYSAAKLGVKGTIGAAKMLGRGAMAGAGLAAGGIKSLFTGGGAVAREAGEAAAETGAKVAGKAAAEAGVKAAGTTAAEAGAEAAAKGPGKAAEKIIAKEGAEAAAETGAKAGGKGAIKAAVAKVIGPKVGKVVAKSIPFVGALAGLGFGIARAMEGDFKGAAAEVAGGTASIFPGVGTAASIATDVGLLARDVYKEAYGIFPEDDPKSGERLDEVKKEVMNYIDENVKGKQTETSVPGPSAPGSTPSGSAPGTVNTPGATTPGSPPVEGGNVSVPVSQVSPSLNTAAGFNAGSVQMALNTNAPAPPMIVNNNNITNSASAGGGGGGGAPGRTSGPAPTVPVQSHIDRALYGDLYGAGIP